MAETTTTNALLRFNVLNKLLKQYSWLTNLYMLEYFTKSNFEKLPLSWQKLLAQMEIEDFVHFFYLSEEKPTDQLVLPLSLLSLRQLLRCFSIQRLRCGSSSHSTSVEVKVTACMHHPRLKNLFVKHVKPKKRYEINLMAEETARLAAESRTDCIVDVGSGAGHLCRVLAYGYAFKVIGIETQEQLCKKARKLDAELEMTASKHLSADEMEALTQHRPKHKAATIDSTDNHDYLVKTLKTFSNSNDCPNFGIIGLHPCGDLAVTLLKIFVSCPHAKFINIVGCCYHKMTIREDTHSGFPLSMQCAQLSPSLSAEARSLGCHAIETYSSRLMKGDYDYLKVHCYRAALERIITKHYPDHDRWGLSNVSHYPDLTFPEYCRKALLKFPLPIPEEDFDDVTTQEDLQSWKKVVFFYSLWLLMGPAIESLILFDRLIYLQENGITGQLKALFDPSLSPRNQVLSAIKKT